MYEDSKPGGSMIGVRLSVMMFLELFVWGAWYVSMTGWMEQAGLKHLIAWAYTVGPIAAVISPFFLGLIADRFFATQRVLATLHLLGGVILLAIVPIVTKVDPATAPKGFFHPYILLLFAHMLCYMPTYSLATSLSLHHLQKPEQFPAIRLWGTIGWIVGNIVVGGNLKTFGLDISWIAEGDKSPVQFYIAGASAIALAIFCLGLPDTPPPAKGKAFSVREAIGLDSLKLLARPGYLVFIFCSFLICIPLAGYYNYARSFVDTIGFQNATLTMTAGQVSEILFMALMPLFFIRLGVKWMLAVGMLAWVARYVLFAYATPIDGKMLAFGAILLHGICYDFFFVTGFIYVDREANKDIRAQAQGFLTLITQGLGLGLGAQLFGMLVTHYSPAGGTPDWKMIWLVPAGFAMAVFVLFVLCFRERKPAQG